LFGGTWTPKSVPGLDLWLLADDLTGNDGDVVTTWTSREGSAYAFTQADNAKRPLLKKGANGINGHNVVRFDGSNDLLVYPAGTISTASEGTVIAVMRYTAALQNNQMLLTSADQAATTRYLRCQAFYNTSLGRNIIASQNDNGTEDAVRGSTVLAENTPYIIVWKSDGTAWSMRINGGDETLTVLGTGANSGDWFGDTSARDNFVIGAQKTTSEQFFLKGDIAELLMYDRGLSLAEIQQIEAYLA
jgi:hypothetical protein